MRASETGVGEVGDPPSCLQEERRRGGGGSGVFKVKRKLHDGSREKRSEKTGQGQVVGKPESQGKGLG